MRDFGWLVVDLSDAGVVRIRPSARMPCPRRFLDKTELLAIAGKLRKEQDMAHAEELLASSE